MKKTVILIYGVASYVMFLGVALYAMAFIGNFGISKTLDAIPSTSFWEALLINLIALALFSIQHSGMARRGFKQWLTRYIPESAERSTYVLMSNLAMIVIFLLWEPMGGVIWAADSAVSKALIMSLYMFGWALVLVSTFLINHFHLFGLQQVWYQFRGKQVPAANFTTPSLYRMVRHPLYVGWIMVAWAATTMTVAHLVFAIMTTAYILVAIQFEEKDLKDEFGEDYARYQKEVPMIIPTLKPKALNSTDDTVKTQV